jgi:hypothetical protein
MAFLVVGIRWEILDDGEPAALASPQIEGTSVLNTPGLRCQLDVAVGQIGDGPEQHGLVPEEPWRPGTFDLAAEQRLGGAK